MIGNIPTEIFDFDMLNLDWDKYIENSENKGQIPSDGRLFELATDSGNPLIQVCIDAEIED